MNVFAAVDVKGVAVGVGAYVIDGQIINARGQNAKVAPMKNRDVPNRHIMAILQADGLVSRAFNLGLVVGIQALSPDHAGADDRNVAQAVAVNQAVFPIVMAKVLELFIPCILAGQIITCAVIFSGANQHGPLIQVKRNLAFHSNRIG